MMERGREQSARKHAVNRCLAALAVVSVLVSAVSVHPAPLVQAKAQGSLPPWLAQVRFIHRGLAVQPPKRKPERGQTKMPLYQQYALQTAQGEKASIAYHDDTTLLIDQKTNAVLTSPHVTYVNSGRVAELLAPGTDHQIKTRTARATAHGTTFMVEVQGKRSTFVVLHGELQVQTQVGSVAVTPNHETVAAPGAAPSRPQYVHAEAAFSWTDEIPQPDLGEDLSLDANGGTIAAYSSQEGGSWDVHRAIDGSLAQGWETAAGQVRNQWIKIGFRGNNLHRVGQVVIDPAATHGDSDAVDLKDFEIRVSTTGTRGADFTQVYRGRCRREATLQRFRLPVPVLARYVELVALDNYGDPSHLAVAEFEAVANEASFSYPWGIAVTQQGNIYVADTGNDRILELSPKGEQLRTWGTKGHGPGQFLDPWGVTEDHQGDIYVADSGNDRVQKFSPAGQFLAQWGSSGGDPGQFSRPGGLAVDVAGNIYVADTGNDRIQELSPQGKVLGVWHRVTSGGTSSSSRLLSPYDVALDGRGHVYVADSGHNRVVELTAAGRILRRWTLPFVPWRVVVDPHGSLYVAGGRVSSSNTFQLTRVYVPLVLTGYYDRLVRLEPKGGFTNWGKPGTGPGRFAYPTGLATDRHGNLYVADASNDRVVKLSVRGRLRRQWGLFGTASQVLGIPVGLALDTQGNVYVTDAMNGRVQLRSSTGDVLAIWGRPAVGATKRNLGLGTFAGPAGIAVAAGSVMYVADTFNHRIQKVTSAGPVEAWHKGLHFPLGVAVDRQGNVYVADCGAKYARVLKFSSAGRVLASWGTYGSGRHQFGCPNGIAVDARGNIYVTDSLNNRLEKLSPSGEVLALWGTPGRALGEFEEPGAVALDAHGNIYVADTLNNRVQEMSPAGEPLHSFGSFGAGLGQFDVVSGVAVDAAGNVYAGDENGARIEKFAPDGTVLAVWE